MSNRMDGTSQQSLESLEKSWDSIRFRSKRFYDEIIELLDPSFRIERSDAYLDDRIISSAANHPTYDGSKGVYHDLNWGSNLVGTLTGTYRGIHILEGERKANDFFTEVYSFCQQLLPRLESSDKARASEIVERVQKQCKEFPYHYGFAGVRYLRDRLESFGFFEKLDEVYATLFILAEITVLDKSSVGELAQALKQGDLAMAKSHLEEKIRIGTEHHEFADSREENMRHYQALRNHLERAYGTAHKLLGGLRPSDVRQVVNKYDIFKFSIGGSEHREQQSMNSI